jgi:hypothetical protein
MLIYLLRSSIARGQCARYTIAKAKQHWSVIGWVTKNWLSRAPSCFIRHVKPLVSDVFAVVSTHPSALGPRGGLYILLFIIASTFSFWVNHKEGLCPSSRDINRLMMMIMMIIFKLRMLIYLCMYISYLYVRNIKMIHLWNVLVGAYYTLHRISNHAIYEGC